MLSYIMFFFFKQKTAYERRISDWSSDVCSSDLITLTRCDQGVDVLIGPVTADGLGALEAMTDFAVKHGLARLSVDRGYGAELVHMPDAPTISFDGIPVALPPSAFLQATVDGERALVSPVQRSVAGGRRIADLFDGLGTFTSPLSRKAQFPAREAGG